MDWIINFHEAFETEFADFSDTVKIEIMASVRLLQTFGPQLSRPHADTLSGSKYANMKELRFRADNGVYRVAYAFDPERAAILLVAGDKSGTSQKRFYKQLITKADERFGEHLQKLKGDQ